MQLQRFFQRFGNLFVGGILRSPLHAMLSKNTLLLTFTGRISGRQYSTPVNYALIDDVIFIFSKRDRTWWRNLRGGAPVSFRWQGGTATGWGEAFEDDAEVERGLMTYLQAVPSVAKYFEVRLDEEGHLKREDVAQAAKPRMLVKITREA